MPRCGGKRKRGDKEATRKVAIQSTFLYKLLTSTAGTYILKMDASRRKEATISRWWLLFFIILFYFFKSCISGKPVIIITTLETVRERKRRQPTSECVYGGVIQRSSSKCKSRPEFLEEKRVKEEGVF